MIHPTSVHDHPEHYEYTLIWTMRTSQSALTAHRVMPEGQPGDAFLQEATYGLHDRFEIEHVTLQVKRAQFCKPCEKASTATTKPMHS
jgi:Co/Zn/Cd efflux system component